MRGGVEVLRAENVTKTFGGLVALDSVSLTIKEGEFVGLIGPNGSGKTTLFNVISGVYKPDGGKVYLFGEDVTGLPPYELYKKGLVRGFQIPRLWRGMAVIENTATAMRGSLGETPSQALLKRRAWLKWEKGILGKLHEMLENLNILHVSLHTSDSVSGGQMKLTDISRALAGEAKILLLDEPTAGVAPRLAGDIFKHLDWLNRELGLTIFVIEHRLEVLFEHVERVIVMHEGRILVEGTPDQVARDPRVLEAYLGG